MTIILVNSKEDNEAFSDVLRQSIKDAVVLLNPTRNAIREALSLENDSVIICGHGTEDGLLDYDWNGYLIDKDLVEDLKRLNVIGIWCYASNFANEYGLHGFFTSMFISNEQEAAQHSILANNHDIENENRWFTEELTNLINKNVPMKEWINYLQNNCHKEHEFVRFNYEALSYFE